MHRSHDPIDTSKGYDVTDLKIRDIVVGTVGFFAFTAVCYVLVLLLMAYGFKNASVPALVGPRPIPEAPHPILQNETTAKTDIYNMRYRENQALNSYGKSEANPGGARIPIDRAMDIVAREGTLK